MSGVCVLVLAYRCRCRVSLQDAGGLRALFFRVAFAFWRWSAGVAARCRWKVLLEGAAVRVVYALWSWHVGATARCRCSVPLQGCCQSAVCTLELACCCRCRVCKEWCILVQGVAARYLWQWAMALMEMTAGPRASRCTDAQMWSRLA